MLKPWLLLPASLSHSLFPLATRLYSNLISKKNCNWQPFQWKGLLFRNRLGIAGGIDKNADLVDCWETLGCGFIEVGTITPEPQFANPGLILDRDLKNQTLWNKMGFPSAGADEAYYNLLHRKTKIPLFVNIGKNRSTTNEKAVEDYISCIDRLHKVADAFVINISSPNTSGLRELQTEKYFLDFLTPIKKKIDSVQRPALVKLSPDMSDEQLEFVIQAVEKLKLDGLVLTNTTLDRQFNIKFPSLKSFPTEGGLSGKVLGDKSTYTLKKTIEILGERKNDFLIISVGGVLTPSQVSERLAMGADLVQCYSALVFEGLDFFHLVHQYFTKKHVE